MNMNKKGIHLIVAVAIIASATISCGNQESNALGKSIAESDTNSQNNELVRVLDKRDGEISASIGKIHAEFIKSSFPNYRIITACKANLRRHDIIDTALAIFSEQEQVWKYIAIVRNEKELEVVEISAELGGIDNFKKNVFYKNRKGELYEVELQCLTKEQALDMNRTIASSEGVIGKIELINDNDVICLIQFGRTGVFSCYSYERKRKNFVYIGGWST